MDAASSEPLELVLPSLDATEALARRVGQLLRPGDAVLLSGPLGAGKSAFARALLRDLVGDPALEVPSPSFTLVQSYETPRGVVHHYDLWRVEPGPDLRELGLDDAFRDIALIEWPDRLGLQTPDDALAITFTPRPDGSRRAVLSGWPDRLPQLMDLA
ncbi:tRNA (adenosine(37)-N6)-threonylcarbamoyltransferase complex ATPase subunit type 1 TsaE [Acidisoma sp.]|uniref:tRNA (adenosine(37)-N6)-threonylcarbamoyltransferase complex ATPase subunit type 1 TsaE n=1 Tax=Acidisoma sp. TaxID=1872115 RepID=UPI003AFF8AD1